MSRREYGAAHEREDEVFDQEAVGDRAGRDQHVDEPRTAEQYVGDEYAEDDYVGDEFEHEHHDVLTLDAHDEFEPQVGHRRASPLVRWGAILAALAVVVVGGYFALQVVTGFLPSSGGSDEVTDYPGPGTGEVIIEVPVGAAGGKIAEILTENDVVSSVSAFTAAAAVDDQAVTLQPGTYRMAERMSGQGALERMLDPDYFESNGVTIREGLWKAEVFATLAKGTEHEVADYEAVDPADLGLPRAAGGEVEGYLFPDTYSFGADDTPTEQLQAMVRLGKKKYAELGLEGEELTQAIIEGSLIQAEGAAVDDLPKISRVIDNRLEADQALGFDSTVHYIFQERGLAGTSDAQRTSDSPYNTYLVKGLPPGPINSPGVRAIQAAVSPADGPWLYFVTTNPSTGETRFAVTFEEHEENVAIFQQWCADNPDDC